MKAPFNLICRHLEAARYILIVVTPILLRTRTRPVIFSKYSGIGDIVCTVPAALELKKRHPQAVFIYNCHPDFACLPRLAGVTSCVTGLIPIGLVGYWYRFLLAGFYQFDSDDDHPDVIPTEVYIKDFGRPFGLTLADDHPRFDNDVAVVDRMKSLLIKNGLNQGPLILIHAGPSWPVREWRQESWTELVTALKQNGFANIAQIGTNNHLALGTVENDLIPNTVSLVNQLTLEETSAVIAQSSLFIGIDSGLLHVAVSVKTPAVGIWGPTSPQFRFSQTNRRSFVVSDVECQGCHHRHPRLHWISGCPFDIRCQKSISVTEVLAACLARLKTDG
jgi:ADP-heptose:LPS heptosyltransferase